MSSRARTLAITIAGAAALFLGRLAWLLVLLAATGVLVGEILRLVRARGIVPVSIVALAGTAALLVTAHIEGERAPRIYPAIIAATLGLAFVGVLLRRGRVEVTRALASTLLPVAIVGVVSSYLVTLRALPDGFRLLVVLIALVVVSEMAAALVVIARRGREPAPVVRALVSALGVVGAAAVAGAVQGSMFSWPTALVLGVLVGIAAPAGRIASEMIERDLRGAAGDLPLALLVRFDGLLLAAPVFFYAFRALAR